MFRNHLIFPSLFLFSLLPARALAAPSIGIPSIAPSALTAKITTDLTATIAIDDPRVTVVALERKNARGVFRPFARLNDRGRRGDSTRGDSIFSVSRQAKFIQAGLIDFRIAARVRLSKNEVVTVTSPTVAIEIAAATVPVAPAPTDPAREVFDSDLGAVICDEALVEFAPTSPVDVALETLQPFGDVIGRVPALDLFQLRLRSGCSAEAVSAALALSRFFPALRM